MAFHSSTLAIVIPPGGPDSQSLDNTRNCRDFAGIGLEIVALKV